MRQCKAPVSRPIAEFPSLRPINGPVLRTRKAIDPVPTRIIEPRHWNLRSNAKQQQSKQTVQSTNTLSFTTKDKRISPCHKRHHGTENDSDRESLIVILRLPKHKQSPVASLQRPSQIYSGQVPNSGRDDSGRNETLAEHISDLRNKKRRLCADLNLIDIASKERAAELQYPSPLSLQPTTKTFVGFTQRSPIIGASIEAIAAEAARCALSADEGVGDFLSKQAVTQPTTDNSFIPWTFPQPVVSIDNYALGHPLFVITGDRWLDSIP